MRSKNDGFLVDLMKHYRPPLSEDKGLLYEPPIPFFVDIPLNRTPLESLLDYVCAGLVMLSVLFFFAAYIHYI